MKKILNLIFTGVFLLLVASPITATALPTQVSAGPACEKSFLGVPPWYRGMTNSDCTIRNPNDFGPIQNFIWRIALNIIQMALTIGVYVAVFFIIYGGFLYMTSGGNSSQLEKARKSVFDAVIGLVILMGAIVINNFIFGIVGSANVDETANGIVGLPQLTSEQIVDNILLIAYYVAGVIAVITAIIAGLNYVTSGGDSGKVAKAKTMLTYSIVGLVLVVTAFAITKFVVGRFN